MRKYGEIELHLLNIQIGCVLRLARLKKGLSQHSLSLMLGSNPTMVGRVERFENVSGWDKIYFISQQLDVDFCSLFILKSKGDLLSIVEASLKLESKLTQDKRDYYTFLKTTITNKYDLLKKGR
ncbi:helix-turn-helix transcriptional regulator [Flavivirga amylovorans]|uniref:Helix-turn-helix transcriptional regulator n=1 Tax=Flavivirga amylovorans TaxID=870486 RepID=A0ABT8WYQ3_9FLAO|nr:helix-turn-helix transcriptional regulator [Flavivirga amylovorans]MDO5986816.1 helix-turn-helix transcriptional regulator [Flavivirga amylovorans]